jgi:hypothetical protein
VMWCRAGNQSQYRRRSQKERTPVVERFLRCIRVKFRPPAGKLLAKGRPCRPFEQQEPPRLELAVIGRSDGDSQNLMELLLRGSWLSHGLDGGRAASGKQAQAGRGIIEGHVALRFG